MSQAVAVAASATASEVFLAKVILAASRGAVGAFVAACLASCTEPVVNRVLVKRQSLSQAISEMKYADIERMFKAALVSNFIKFPFFEIVNMIVSNIDLPNYGRGTIVGMVFTTATLPITNYRFRESMGLPVTLPLLFQAYPATVMRDIVYGIVRNTLQPALLAANPGITKTKWGAFKTMFQVVFASCVISAPGNEARGYCLQNPTTAKPFSEFFRPMNSLRSTINGALILSTSIATGAVMTAPIAAVLTGWRDRFNGQLQSQLLAVFFVLGQFLASRRNTALIAAVTSASPSP